MSGCWDSWFSSRPPGSISRQGMKILLHVPTHRCLTEIRTTTLLSWSTQGVIDLRLHVQDQDAGHLCSWWEPSSWLPDSSFLAVSSHMMGKGEGGKERENERKRKFSSGSSYKGANPTMRASPLRPHLNLMTSQRPCLLKSSHQELRIPHLNLRVDTIQPIANTQI